MMTTKERDFHLVQKALGGDNKACEQIYNRFYNSLNYTIGRIVSDSEIALDLTMETFEKVFTRLHRYQPDFCLSTWVNRIGTNCALDYIRKANRVTVVSIEASYDNDDVPNIQVMDERPTADEDIVLKQKVEYIREVMQYLTKYERRLLTCYYFEEMDWHEIADEMDIPVQYVKHEVRCAKKKLQRLTEEISERMVINKINKRKYYEEKI